MEPSEFTESPIYNAICSISDDDFVLKDMISICADNSDGINCQGYCGEGFLHSLLEQKCSSGHMRRIISTCYILADTGIDVNIKDNKGNTPLHFAVLNQSPVSVICVLMKLGSDPNILNQEEKTSLQLTDDREVKYIIEYFGNGLWDTISNKDSTFVEILFDSWSSIYIKRKGKPLLDHAEKKSSEKICLYLNRYKPTYDVISAALSGNSKKLKNALKNDESNVNVEEKRIDVDGVFTATPLLCEVVKLGLVACAKELLKRDDCDVNLMRKYRSDEEEPLFWYILNIMQGEEWKKITGELIKRANIGLLQHLDHFEILYATWNHVNWSPKVLTTLVENNISLLARDKNGYLLRDHILIAAQADDKDTRQDKLQFTDQLVLKWFSDEDEKQVLKATYHGHDYLAFLNMSEQKKKRKKSAKKKMSSLLNKVLEIQVHHYTI